MENLILYLYNKHIHSKDPNAKLFAKLQPIKVYSLSPQQLEFYNSIFIRNILTYSATTMEFRLSLKNLFGFYRLHKFQTIMKNAGAQYFFKEWIGNQLMPITIPSNKKIPNNCPYVFYDFHQQQPQQVQNQEKVELKKTKSKSKGKGKQKQKDTNKEQSEKNGSKNAKNSTVMINVLELTNHLQNQTLAKQLGMDLSQLKNAQRRKQAIYKYKTIKIQQYINQRFDKDALMVFNFISHYPFIQQKQLLNRTMISAVQLRKSLGLLIADGIVNFYPQSSKSMLYKAISTERIIQKYIDHIAQSILNLYMYMGTQQQKDQQKITMILQTLSHLDDILMIFMA